MIICKNTDKLNSTQPKVIHSELTGMPVETDKFTHSNMIPFSVLK